MQDSCRSVWVCCCVLQSCRQRTYVLAHVCAGTHGAHTCLQQGRGCHITDLRIIIRATIPKLDLLWCISRARTHTPETLKNVKKMTFVAASPVHSRILSLSAVCAGVSVYVCTYVCMYVCAHMWSGSICIPRVCAFCYRPFVFTCALNRSRQATCVTFMCFGILERMPPSISPSTGANTILPRVPLASLCWRGCLYTQTKTSGGVGFGMGGEEVASSPGGPSKKTGGFF